ncbi:MAG TPA: sulfite exporter TauE/SafE family protein [Chryseosolibacter sp.]
MNIVILLIIGLVAGILGGLLGIGGAVIIIPALVFALGYSQLQAQGTTLLMLVMPVGLMAAWQYYRGGYVDVKAAIILAATFFVGSYIGAKLAIHIPADMLKKAFAAMLVVIAVKIFFDTSH